VVLGDRDGFLPAQAAADMYAATPGTALWVVPEGLHVPLYGTRQPEFERIALGGLAAPKPD